MTLAAKTERRVELPEGVNVQVSGCTITVSGPKGQLKEEFKLGPIKVEQQDKELVISTEFPRRRQNAMIGTVEGKVKNMIDGVMSGYEYKLQVIYSHFPVTLNVENNEVIIKNFLGEKHPRKSKIFGNAEVKIKGQEITVTGANKEEVGQTAANLVQNTKIKGRDQRVFKDGIFLTEKNVIANE